MQGIFRKENTDKALKYGIYRHLPTYEKIIRNLVSFSLNKMSQAFLYNEKQIKALNVETVKRNLDVPKIIYLISFPRNSTFGIVFLRISI